MAVQLRNNLLLALGFLVVIALVACNAGNSFFWDTIQLGSVHANYYLTTNFSTLLLPNDIDSGHIPAFGMYIALVWKIFGRSLEASHLAILPFAIGIVWQLRQLTRRFIPEQYSGIAVILILLDPTLLTQMTMVSPDVPLVLFFLMGVNAVLGNKKGWLAISVLLLFMTSMRGMMVSVCLLSLDIYCNVNLRQKLNAVFLALVKRSIIYLPGLILFVIYNVYHYNEKGWIGYHKDSPWAKCFERVDFKGFLLNIGFYGWRLLDFGRAGIWLVFIILFVIYRKVTIKSERARLLLFFFICTALLLPANMLWAKNLMAHRYLIPIYLVFALLCATLLFADYVGKTMKVTLAFLWFIILLTGNYWAFLYPAKIAKGWESTLAHLPYYKLRHQAIAYLEAQHINFSDVDSFFPNAVAIDYIDLNNDPRVFKDFDGRSQYVFYSNVFNTDHADYDKMAAQYHVVKEFESNGVFVKILKKGKP